jgi:hypothetical protein
VIKSKRMRWAGHVERVGARKNVHRILLRKCKGKIPLGRTKRRWEDDIKIDLKEVGWEGVNWINLAQDMYKWRTVVNTVMKLRVP